MPYAIRFLRRICCALGLWAATAPAVQAGPREDCERVEDRDLRIRACTEIIRGDGKAGWAYLKRGIAYYSNSDYDRAIADLTEAIRINPGNSTSYVGRGSAYNATGEQDRAIADLSEAIRLDPSNFFAYSERAYAHNTKGNYERAIADCNEAIRLGPKGFSAPYAYRGKAYHGKGDYHRAIADYDEAIRLSPNHLLARLYRGETYEARGERDKAIEDYNKALSLPAQKWLEDKRAEAAKRLAALRAVTTVPVPIATPPLSTATSTPLGRRVALVIGNAGYKVEPLQNPGNDAAAVAEALEKQLKFDKVILRLDLGRENFLAALREFSREATGAGLALVYFAGHATERGGKNFLIPIDARLDKVSDLGLETILLDTVLEQLAGATTLKLVILDSCRNSMFPMAGGGDRSGSRGLRRVEPGRNTLVVYAAKEGTVAADGIGRKHSPFTAALLKHIATPGLEINFVFRRVRDDVLAATAHQKDPQEPYVYGTLGREKIFLRP